MLNLIYFIRNKEAKKLFSAGIFIQQNGSKKWTES